MPPEWQTLLLNWGDGKRRGRFFAQRNLFDILDQPERLVLVAPEFGGVTASRDQLPATVFLVNNVTA